MLELYTCTTMPAWIGLAVLFNLTVVLQIGVYNFHFTEEKKKIHDPESLSNLPRAAQLVDDKE
jgi:hypothetical protein